MLRYGDKIYVYISRLGSPGNGRDKVTDSKLQRNYTRRRLQFICVAAGIRRGVLGLSAVRYVGELRGHILVYLAPITALLQVLQRATGVHQRRTNESSWRMPHARSIPSKEAFEAFSAEARPAMRRAHRTTRVAAAGAPPRREWPPVRPRDFFLPAGLANSTCNVASCKVGDSVPGQEYAE